MKYYYVDREKKVVHIYDHEPENISLEFLGSTENPKPKMAAGKFLKDEPGFKILIH